VVPLSEAEKTMGAVSHLYETKAVEYAQVAEDAARAESEYKRARAKAILHILADGGSAAKAEGTVDADDHIGELLLAYKLTAATADSHRARLTQLRERLATGRSIMVNEREADKAHMQRAT
jgi:hypothetical protein